jgi:hypothetical protein
MQWTIGMEKAIQQDQAASTQLDFRKTRELPLDTGASLEKWGSFWILGFQ